jgi:CheY-like chemotaxis protein
MTNDHEQILYVEDDASDAELTLLVMQRQKLTGPVHLARDGAEALDFLFCQGAHSEREFTVPKFVLLDLKLPKINGLQVLQAIRNDPRTVCVPVIILTSSKEPRDIVESYRLRANSYVQKPVNFEAFRQTVQQLGQYWSNVNLPPGPPAEAS